MKEEESFFFPPFIAIFQNTSNYEGFWTEESIKVRVISASQNTALVIYLQDWVDFWKGRTHHFKGELGRISLPRLKAETSE